MPFGRIRQSVIGSDFQVLSVVENSMAILYALKSAEPGCGAAGDSLYIIGSQIFLLVRKTIFRRNIAVTIQFKFFPSGIGAVSSCILFSIRAGPVLRQQRSVVWNVSGWKNNIVLFRAAVSFLTVSSVPVRDLCVILSLNAVSFASFEIAKSGLEARDFKPLMASCNAVKFCTVE